MTLLQYHLFALGLIGVSTATLGGFILYKGPRRFLNRIFALYMLAVAWWSFWELWSQFSPNEPIAVIRLRTEYFGVCLIPTLFYHGVSVLLNATRRLELIVCYGLSAVFIILIGCLRDPLFLPDAVPMAYLPFWGKAGPLYFLCPLFFTAVVIRAHRTLWRASRQQPSPMTRKQLTYLFASSTLAYIGGVPEFFMKGSSDFSVGQFHGFHGTSMNDVSTLSLRYSMSRMPYDRR